MQQELNLRRCLDVLRRRYPFLVVPAFVIFVGACVLAYKLPRIYEASATILVESQQIPTSLALSTVTANAAERIQFIQQRLMTRDNLLQIAGKFALFGEERRPSSSSRVIDQMRQATTMGQIEVDTQRVIGFTVSFRYSDPVIASRVANEFVASILSQNIQTRLSQAEETSKFFQQELATLDRDLAAMESRIGEFKRANDSALPETLPFRRTLLLQLSADIADIDQQIRLASTPGGVAGYASNDRVRQLDHDLRARQLALDSVREERATLAPLAEKGFIPENRIREMDRSIAAAELDVEAARIDIAAHGAGASEFVVEQLKKQRAELEQRAAVLNEGILKTPEVEVELSALTRDFENLQAEYRQAKANFADAATGKRLEEDRHAERFDVIEHPTVPEVPVKPNRPRIILAGAFGGMGVGVAIVLLLEMLTKSIRTVADLQNALQLRPIATIPYITTSSQRRAKRLRLAAALFLVLLTISGGLWLLHLYYLPLDLLVDKVAQRIGL